jgi:hypothetical protein
MVVVINRTPTKNSHIKRRVKMKGNMDGAVVAKRSAIIKKRMGQESKMILHKERLRLYQLTTMKCLHF